MVERMLRNSGKLGTTMADNATRWEATFNTDGSGNWEMEVPPVATFEDMQALSPVIDEIRTFLRPTVDDAA